MIESIEMKKIKVVVKLFTDEQFFGYLYVKDSERIQDLLNDDRHFLPFEKSHTERGPGALETPVSNIVINKRALASVEER